MTTGHLQSEVRYHNNRKSEVCDIGLCMQATDIASLVKCSMYAFARLRRRNSLSLLYSVRAGRDDRAKQAVPLHRPDIDRPIR